MRATFTVPGPPIAKARPRVTRSGNTYTPGTTEAYAQKVQLCARTAGVRPLSCEFTVGISFYMPTVRRVDVDNLAKGILDALNGVAWEDDSQVFQLHVLRLLDRASPRAVVTLEWPE